MPPKKLIQAQAFELVDRLGRRRASLGMPNDFTMELCFFDCEGDRRASLQVNDIGSTRLQLHDDAGAPRLSMAIETDGEPNITLYDQPGAKRVELSLGAGDLPNLALRNGDQRTQLLLRVDEGVPSIILNDAHGEHRIVFQIQKDGRVGLGFYGRHGEGRAVIGLDENDNPKIRLVDKSGDAAGATVSLDGNKLMLTFER